MVFVMASPMLCNCCISQGVLVQKMVELICNTGILGQQSLLRHVGDARQDITENMSWSRGPLSMQEDLPRQWHEVRCRPLN